jgi:glycosyltransferase involved in cell wall biosynthesis
MSPIDPARTLFVARATTPSGWFRCAMPAMHLGADWCGVVGDPPHVEFVTGVSRRPLSMERMADYDTVVLQWAGGQFIPHIEQLQAAGTTVLYEMDSDIRGLEAHPMEYYRERFNAEVTADIEMTIAACDGVLVPTAYLADRYRAINPRVWVCRNGLDLARFDLTRTPDPERVTIGWAGYVGHNEAIMPWLKIVARIMRKRANVRFHTAGIPFAALLEPEFGERVLALPWSDLMSYPAGMVDFDIAIAPAGPSPFFRSKSDLRWLEASAFGIPAVAEPRVYHEIEHGVTGFHARDPKQAERWLLHLVDDAAARERVGAAARAHLLAHRTLAAMAPQWTHALAEANDTLRSAA